MSSCIRCGAEVSPQGRSYQTADGEVFCPSSLPGEAAVHRLAGRLPSVAPKRSLWGSLAKAFIAYEAGRGVGRIINGPAHDPAPAQRTQDFYTSAQKIAGTYDPNA